MQQIKIDFDNPGMPKHLDVMEKDSQSRFFQAVLYKDGKAYVAPSGATYSIMYRGFGPQNEGWYDTINDGAGKRAACSVSGNIVTCEIARQALRVPGHVSVMLCVTGSNGYMLHGWPIDCNCRNDNYTVGTSVESFFYITQVTNADWTSAIKTWEELKNMIDPTLSVEGKAADARTTGNAIKNAETALDNKKADKTDLDVERKRIDVLNDGGLNLKDEVIDTSIKTWLNDHPEATTTVQDKSIDLKKLSNEAQSVIVGINSGIDSISYSNAIKKGYIDTFVCSENYKVYDFKNVTVKNLIVNCIFSTIKNVKVTVSFKIEDEARNCIFSNLRSEIPTESVTFGENTWAHKFIDCIFIGNGNTICFKQGYRKGDTLICNNCYYYNMFAIFKPDRNGFGIINGGWGDNIQYIIYADAFANGNYTIANYDFETINNVLYTSGKASNFDLNISGTISACKSIVFCDDQTNATVVNLIYNCNLLKNFKIFGGNYVFLYKSCNVIGDNLCNYPLNAINREITLEVLLPPKCYYEPFKSIIHLYSASWDDKYDGKINVYFGNDQYAKDSIYNGVKKFGILNKTEDFILFAFTINTRNRLFSPI